MWLSAKKTKDYEKLARVLILVVVDVALCL